MKKEFLKIAGVKSEKEFYKKYPSEEAFFKAHPKALSKLKKHAEGGEAYPTTTPQTATMDNFFSYGVPVPPTFLAHGGSPHAFPMAQSEKQFFIPAYTNVYNPYNKAMGGSNIETYNQAIHYGNDGDSKAFLLMQDGGQQDPQQVLMQIAQALQQGTPPEQVLKYLVDNGVPQDKAVEIIKSVMSQIQGSGQEAAAQEQMAAEQPAMEDGGVTEIPDPSRERIANFTTKVNDMAKTANEKRLASMGTGMFKKGGARKLKGYQGGGSKFDNVNDLIDYISASPNPDDKTSYSAAGNQLQTNNNNYLTKEDLTSILDQYFKPGASTASQGDMSMFAPMLAQMFAQNPNALANMFSQAAANGKYMFTEPSNLYKFTASMNGQKLRGMYGNQHIYEALFPQAMQDAIVSGKFSEMMANNPEFRSIADTYGLQGITHKRKGFFPRLFGNKEVVEYDFRVPKGAPTVTLNGDPYDADKNGEYDARELLENKPDLGSPNNPIMLPDFTIPYSQQPASSSSNGVPFYLDPNSGGAPYDPNDPQLLRDMQNQDAANVRPPLLPPGTPVVGIPPYLDPSSDKFIQPFQIPYVNLPSSTYTPPGANPNYMSGRGIQPLPGGLSSGIVTPTVTPSVTPPPATQTPASTYNPPAFDLDYSLKNIVSPLELTYGRTDLGDITGDISDWRSYKPVGMGSGYNADNITDRWNETLANTSGSNRSDLTQGELHKVNMEAVKNLPDPIKEIAVDTSMNKDLDMRILLMTAAGINTPLGDLKDFNNRKKYYYDPKNEIGPTSADLDKIYNDPKVQAEIMKQYNDDPKAFTESILAYRDMFDQRLNSKKNKRGVSTPGASYPAWHNRNAGLQDFINQRYFSPSTGYVDPYGTSTGPMLDMYNNPNWKKYGGPLKRYAPGGPMLSPNIPPINQGQVIQVQDPTKPEKMSGRTVEPLPGGLTLPSDLTSRSKELPDELKPLTPDYGYDNIHIKEKNARFVGEDKFYRNQVIKNQATQFLNKPSIQSKYFGMQDPLEQYYASLETGATPVTRGDFNVLDKNNIPSPYNRNPIRRDYSESSYAKMGGSMKQNDIMYMDENMIRDFVAKGGQIEYLD